MVFNSGTVGLKIAQASGTGSDAVGRERRALGNIVLTAVIGMLALVPAVAARADDAEVVSLIGKGDSRETADADWKPTAVKQKLRAGWFVRTREMSQMALLLKDSTQVRLNQLSILNIKSIGAPPQPTRLELPQGRAWAQAKPGSTAVAGRKPPAVEVATPSATAAIRGTDWEIVVDKDGTSTVTVLSGEVEFYNDQGRVLVMPNEQARAAPGKAPTKILLSNAAERVQWVTAYRPQPRRWVKDYSGGIEAIVRNIEAEEFPAAVEALSKAAKAPRPDVRVALLLADLNLFQGEAATAIGLLSPHADDGRGNPMASALLARAFLVAGRIADAGRILGNAAQKHAAHVEVLLSQAEYSRIQGDADATRRAALKALEADPKNAEAWYVIGRIETEREYPAAAREALNRALALRPEGPGYRGELATLETFANEFPAAEKAFTEALAQQPDDYVALTGLGVLQLKRGETQAALESFLKAGVVEPKYARAWLFSAVAYYQLGDRARALEALQKASSLDEKDPLPYLMSSLVYYDSLELGRAIEEARKAQVRMPFLKSLNQVLTDQKGSANVGSALAAFGMEEWSQAYAYDSYSPYWAGSSLFLADRFSGTYNKNSELFKGFLSDPSVFGASNRFSSLVPVPGHYASVGATARRDYITDATLNATLNGYSVSAVPFSYFLSLDGSQGESRINRTETDSRLRLNGENLVVGVGMKPIHELALFAFGNATHYDGRFFGGTSALVDDDVKVDYRRFDAGLNYKFSPTNHAWLKIGDGTEAASVSGAYFDSNVANTLNKSTIFGPLRFGPMGRVNPFRYDSSQRDMQWRHSFDVSPDAQLSWGLEYAKQGKPTFQTVEFFNVNPAFPPYSVRLVTTTDSQIESASAYLSGRFMLAPAVDAQIDLHYQDLKARFVGESVVDFSTAGPYGATGTTRRPFVSESHERELNPRIGIKWRPATGHTLRFAAQSWRKPAGVNTLAPVDTAGIPLDDQIEREGGRLQRARLQHEIEWDNSTFLQWFLDVKRVENLDRPELVKGLQILDLDKLRVRKRSYALRQDYLEDTPDFGAGRVNMAGLAVNRLLSRHYTLAGRYIYADTRNTTTEFGGREIPFHPKHYVNLALNWQPYRRWFVGPTATYRSSRFSDEENAVLLTAGWSFGLQAYWESEDKRLSVGAVIDQVHSDKQSSIYRHPVAQLQAAYRF